MEKGTGASSKHIQVVKATAVKAKGRERGKCVGDGGLRLGRGRKGLGLGRGKNAFRKGKGGVRWGGGRRRRRIRVGKGIYHVMKMQWPCQHCACQKCAPVNSWISILVTEMIEGANWSHNCKFEDTRASELLLLQRLYLPVVLPSSSQLPLTASLSSVDRLISGPETLDSSILRSFLQSHESDETLTSLLSRSPPLFFQISLPAAASQNPFTVALSQNPVTVVAVFTRHRCCSRTAGVSRCRRLRRSKSVAPSPFCEQQERRAVAVQRASPSSSFFFFVVQ
ncbi:uncharacterized protein DS421_6g172400 [Arachis hypogaea]|nr:uncharacterized protein DS421_6g172400 [Arachis hypogaea]